jgi:Flp pilus assembly protein TadB
MSEVLLGTGAAVGAGAAWWMWRVQRLRRIARERLNEDLPTAEGEYVVTLQPTLRRKRWIPIAAGLVVALIGLYVLGLALVYCVALGVIVGVMGSIIEGQYAGRCAQRLDMQLATAIDLMVAALSAGAGVSDAIESAANESKEPLGGELQELLGRIRYGEAPQRVFEDFALRIPLEAYRLFCFTMAVHGEVGGSLAPTLATVGRSIRDRIEIGRRIRAQATEAQVSVIGIVCVTYFLGLLMWRTNPQHFEEFLKHPVGADAVAGAMILQAIGLLWITKMSQLRF